MSSLNVERECRTVANDSFGTRIMQLDGHKATIIDNRETYHVDGMVVHGEGRHQACARW